MELSYYKKFEPIDGKWYITRELGSGAFGTVFEVERKDEPGMKSAIKVISIPRTQSEVRSYSNDNYDLDEKSISSYFYGFVEEFKKEILVMSRLRGYTNIVSYEDHEIIQKDDGIGWDIFIRMELLTPLNEYYKDYPPNQRDIIKLGIDICRALEICGKYNIVHRDIKPGNIFVSETGDYKLGDFGVARTLEKTTGVLSKKGTYTYMAPEVCKNEEYGPGVDIYSLGIVLYKLLNNNLEPFRTQRTPQDEENALTKRLRGEAVPAPVNASAGLGDIILKAVEYNPMDRYATPADMREDLETLLHSEKSDEIIGSATDDAETRYSDNEATRGIFSAYVQPQEADESNPEIADNENKPTDWTFAVIIISLVAFLLFIIIGYSVNNTDENAPGEANYIQSEDYDFLFGEWEIVGRTTGLNGVKEYYDAPIGKWTFYDDGTYLTESYETGEAVWWDYEIKANNSYSKFIKPSLNGEDNPTWYRIELAEDELVLPSYFCEYNPDTDSYNYEFSSDSEIFVFKKIQ
ncbi:MAG: serine/threonine protein kinase [Clostridia bacterium]|nr:serine/threonine protein kinase [Clostridia bacterium]